MNTSSFPRPTEGVSDARRRNMRAVRDRDTKPEMVVRRMLHRMGFRFRLHRADLPGRPDIVLPSRRKVIEVRGCFWHRHSRPDCPKAGLPATRQSWWEAKLASNVERDQRNLAALKAAGWNVLEIWECELADPTEVAARLTAYLDGDEPSA